jgi:NSS family neurotransmitter:Na+ symporter
MAQFGSRIGMILATAGSAVGLGNIWRFPTTVGENGGAALILVYIIFTVILGLPGIISEFIVGRNGKANACKAYKEAVSTLPPAGRKMGFGVGLLGLLCSTLILGFYSVVAGWCIYYFAQAVLDNVLGSPEHIGQEFSTLTGNAWIPSILAVIFILLTHFIIIRGVRGGIERASKIMMPLLFILMIALIIASCTLPNASSGIVFLFHPDFSKLTGQVLFEALGQSFFSLSLGTACLCTYASYFKDDVNLIKASAQIAGIDCIIAIMAGLMIFPAAFSVGIQPDAGPSLICLTLPNVFEAAFPDPVAYVISILFFVLLSMAALTSTISLHEIGTSMIHEEMNTSRSKAACGITVFCSIIGILSALSMGVLPMGFFGDTLFGNFDTLTSNILLPAGALFTTIIVGWIMPKENVIIQLTSQGRYRLTPQAASTFFFLVRFMCPLLIVLIFLKQTGIL